PTPIPPTTHASLPIPFLLYLPKSVSSLPRSVLIHPPPCLVPAPAACLNPETLAVHHPRPFHRRAPAAAAVALAGARRGALPLRGAVPRGGPPPAPVPPAASVFHLPRPVLGARRGAPRQARRVLVGARHQSRARRQAPTVVPSAESEWGPRLSAGEWGTRRAAGEWLPRRRHSLCSGCGQEGRVRSLELRGQGDAPVPVLFQLYPLGPKLPKQPLYQHCAFPTRKSLRPLQIQGQVYQGLGP
ncbi:unnamed protein product, partial [Urochloa humidicola]